MVRGRSVMVRDRSHGPCSPLVRKERAEDCSFAPRSELRRPDPAIYSQRELLGGGGLAAPLTWNNPDIVTNLWQPARLRPEASITVHNRSAVASAAAVRVDVFAFRFGMGLPREQIGGSQVSIVPSGQATFLAPFPQTILSAEPRIGVEVRITHSTDANAANNVGLHAHQVFYTSEVGRQFQLRFPVRNPSDRAQNIGVRWTSPGVPITVDSPSGWGTYGPFEERQIVAYVDTQNLPVGPAPRAEVVFMALAVDAGDELIDGLSFQVIVDA